MAVIDLNEEWLGHVQPVGLVIAPVVLARHGLNPETQTRADSEEVRKLIAPKEDGASTKSPEPCALKDPWTFFEKILGWRANLVAGAPGGLPLPEDLSLRVDESDTEIAPHWAVVEPDGGWQIFVRIEAAGIKPDDRGAIEGWEASPHQRLERLLREKEVPIGLLITDEELRFVYAPRGEHVGERDVGQHNFQQPIKQCVVGDVVGIKPHLNENLCNPEIICCRIKDAV
jgi:hypothetical protein